MNRKQGPVRRGRMPSNAPTQPKLFTDNLGISYTNSQSGEVSGENKTTLPFDVGSRLGFLQNGIEPELTGRVVALGDPGYNVARREFNCHFSKFPQVIVFSQDTKDVINALRWAKYYQVPLRMRSGRHSYEGLSAVDGGIVVDMSDMYQVGVDKRRGTVTVQAGIRGGVLNELLWGEGLVVPMGLCPTTGIAGMTLGGGHGILSRPYGLTLDNLLGLEMVNADGRVLQANASQHPDLFWASRGGGGGNFGICTTLRFRAHAIDTVGYVEIGWDLGDLEAVIRAWQNYTVPGADGRLTMTLAITSSLQSTTANPAPAASDPMLRQEVAPESIASQADPTPQLGPEFTWQPDAASQADPMPQPDDNFPILMQGVFLGPTAELCRLLEPLLRTGSPRKVTIQEIPWIEAAKLVARMQPTTPLPFKGVGLNVLRPLPEDAVVLIRRFIESPPTSSVSVLFHGLGGAVARVPSYATAYYYRQALYTMTPFATWNQYPESRRGVRWVERFRRAMQPYTEGVYVNTMDLDIRHWQEAYYGQNFPRLARVKAKYDPANFFNFPQSIPPAR